MFSKPILIAASVASAQAALLAQNAVAATATQYSDSIGCGLCLAFGEVGGATTKLPSKYIMGGAKYETLATALATALPSANTIAGDVCCNAATTKQYHATAASAVATYCAGVFAGDASNDTVVIAASQYFQSALAQCPMYLDNCTLDAFDKADAADSTVVVTDKRSVLLAKGKIGNYVTLKMIALKTGTATGEVGTAPALKQRIGDVCTWVVAADCDAPVITVAAGTTAAAAEWNVQVTEWSGEFLTTSTLTTGTGPTWTTQVGATSKLYYPPLTATMVTDLQASAVAVTTPNDVMGDISFKTATATTDITFQTIPGNILSEWSTWLASVYTSKKADNATYETELAKWVTFLAYKAPEAGLFVPAVDPKAPAKMSKPRAPTQAVDTPSTLANFAKKGTTAVPIAALNLYNNKAGYGYPSAYQLTTILSKSGKPFGTLAGGQQAATPTNAWAAATMNGLSVRKTSNKAADGVAYITTCDKSYVMITGVLAKSGAVAKTVELKVTAQEFQKTLEQQIPVRSGAPTIAGDAPAGAAQLAASAVAAALTALYLF